MILWEDEKDIHKRKAGRVISLLFYIALGFVLGNSHGNDKGYNEGRCATVSSWDEYQYNKIGSIETTTKITHACETKDGQ